MITVFSWLSMQPIPDSLNGTNSAIIKPQLLDRHLKPITITYKNHWNLHNVVPLNEIPEFLQRAFIASEDKRFYQHHGIDWVARLHALWQNMTAMTRVRGASTITEQTIKMLHPRPRTLWTRWLEGLEATQLEKRIGKNEILEFYLNQVPYSAQRRGIVQAAHYYFDRDLDTLNHKEMLTLAVIVRAPSRLDPLKHPFAATTAIERLATNIGLSAPTSQDLLADIQHRTEAATGAFFQPINAGHFANFVYDHAKKTNRRIHTTLDLNLQRKTQSILEQRLHKLQNRNVRNGAVLIVDHKSNEILSWVVAGEGDPEHPGSAIDAVTTPRQPGSTLKPLLYTMALESGFTAATLIDDSPLSESVGFGSHSYHNYSRRHYGPVSVREALGNSLNIPAVKTLQQIGTEQFLETLHKLGIDSLKNHPDVYGDGLALGNGEITLYELIQAYSTLASQGQSRPLRIQKNLIQPETGTGTGTGTDIGIKRIFSKESTSLVADILSDPKARQREFGSSGLLDFPIQTAVKTGTSNDYRDAWAIGFNHRYTVGIWMGNMDRESMNKITGSVGPAFVLRSVFAELNKYKKTKPLYFSNKLTKTTVCKETGLLPAKETPCTPFSEWFINGTQPTSHSADQATANSSNIRIQQPSPNLQMALDPRIPDHQEQFRFSLNQSNNIDNVEWILDDHLLAETATSTLDWTLARGTHRLRVVISRNEKMIAIDRVNFSVK